MVMKIAPDVVYLSRAEWGADESLPRLGTVYPADEPTEAIVHHTVISDNDDTPLYWESVTEVILAMRRLQTIRPDLGDDVPYSYLGFLMKYAHKIGFILCEGRGPYRRGAHTRYHNRTGRALAIQGNTMGADLKEYAQMIGRSWGWIKDEHGLVNLGSVRPPRAPLFGHRDFRRENDRTTWTVCPGDGAYSILPTIKIERYQPEQEDEEMRLVRERSSGFVFVMSGVWYSYLHRIEDAVAMGVSTDIEVVPDGTLQSYVRADKWWA